MKRKHLINKEIKNKTVRIVSYFEDTRIINTDEAISIAISENKDLILINPNQDPPIAKIMEYGKFMYECEKAEKERKKNSVTATLKEIKISTNIGENDFMVKLNKSIEFLKAKDKVKCTLQVKGRQKPEMAKITILRFVESLEDYGAPEYFPKFESGKWHCILKPKK